MSFSLMISDANKFCRNLFDKQRMTTADRERWTKEFILQATVELGEVLGEINWKHHKPANKHIDRQKLLEELVDVLKFWANIVAMWDFTPVDIMRCWVTKTQKVTHLFAEQKKSGWVFVDGPMEAKQEIDRRDARIVDLENEYAELDRNYQQLRNEYDSVR